MPSWKKVIVSGSDATLNSLLVSTAFTASGLNYPSSDGTVGQVVTTDGAGNLSFSNIENTTIIIKNVSGATIAKGTPCYITGSGTSGNLAGVWPADASNPARMPAGVIAGETLTAGAEGIGLINGYIANVDTAAFAAGNSIYVAVGGGYTNVKPTGSSVLIQKLGNVEKSHASNGSGVINGPAYYNEVPNIQQGYTWVGNSNGVAIPYATSSIQNVVSSSYALTASSTTAVAGTTNYVSKFTSGTTIGNSQIFDNGTNVGVGTTSPGALLQVGDANQSTDALVRLSIAYSSDRASRGGINWRDASNTTGKIYTEYDGTMTSMVFGSLYNSGYTSNQTMIIRGNGNVGIGTTTPAASLSFANSTGNKIDFYYTTTSGGDRYGIQVQSSELRIHSGAGGDATGGITFGKQSTSTYTETMRITNSGNVGIGETNPNGLWSGTNRTLQITAGTNTSSELRQSRTGASITRFLSGTSDTFGVYTANALNYEVYTNNVSRLFITSGGDVGIGNTSPGFKLQVNGDVGIGQFTNGTATIDAYGGHAFFGCDGTQIAINGSTSNVGIGTTSPGNPLHVEKDAGGSAIAYFNSLNADGYGVAIRTADTGNDKYVLRLDSNSGSTPVMYATNAGNVGIGTTSPTSNLQVQSNNLSAPAFAVSKSFSGGGDGTAVMHAFGYDSGVGNTGIQVGVKGTGGFSATDAYPFRVFNGGTSILDVKSNNGIRLNSYGSGTFTGTVAYTLAVDSSGNIIETTGGGGSGTVNGGTAGYVAYYPSSGTTVDDSGIYWDSGNSRMAVGNTSPSYKVDVSGDIRATGAVYANANGAMYFQGGDDVALYDINISNHLGVYGQQDSTVGSIKLGSGGGIISGKSSNIGIGTINPTYKLDVSASSNSDGIRIQNAGASRFIFNGDGVALWGGASANGGQLTWDTGKAIVMGQSGYALSLGSNGTWDRMYINTSGDVGIGTTSPGSKLHISTTSSNPFRMVRTGGAATNFGFEIGGGEIGLYDYTTSAYNWYVASTGNIGIGTTSPNTKLDVNGNTLITGSLRVTAGITGSLNGNADTVTWTDSATSTFAIATSDGTTAYYDAAGDLRWDGAAKVISVSDGAETLSLNGKYIVQTGTGLLNYYADRHVFGDNAFNYQGQLIGGSFDAALDITCGGTKFFDIPHQSKPGWGLKHGAIEGPESAVYFRGKLNDSNVIEFPAYWEWLVHSESITVSLTPIGSFQPLYVAKIENNQAVIASNDQPINCHFVVYGERKDVEQWDVEYPGYSRGQVSNPE